MPDSSEIIGTFGGDEAGCEWVESNGTRYEFFGPGTYELFFRTTPVSLQDYTGQVLVRVGDPIRVVGQVAGVPGSGCQPNFILATEVSAP